MAAPPRTRTDRYLAVIAEAIEQHRASIDAEEGAAELTIVVKTNPGGVPRFITVSRKVEEDLAERTRQ